VTFTVSSHSAFALFFWQLHRIAEFEPTRFKHRLRWKSHSIFVMILWSGWSWPRSGRVGFHGWIPGLDHVGWWESGVLTKGQIWPNLRWFEMILESCPSIPNMCYFCGCRICFFHVWRLRCKNGISWDVFHCGKNPRSEVRMVSSLSKACWLINNFLIWAEKKCFTCFTIHYNIHY